MDSSKILETQITGYTGNEHIFTIAGIIVRGDTLAEMTKEEQIKENDKKKEYLKSYIPLKNRTKRLEEEIAELRLSKMCPRIVNDGMPHGTDISDLSNYAAAFDRLERELVKARYDRITRYTEIFRKIEMMEDETEKDLLTLKYLRGMHWEEICVELSYEWTWVHKLHRDALQHFQL